ncbi:hypothetical protein TraAM80_03558 [Trypanosoma rangeli]|uniref:Uncharacterized protein n=1 Tax=Trypanosoma rangeli TaxID=5698 RepID=A0A422NP23_TRYRA|nr:uncharacterized protein TraAM80_03558 [Trypanosoma rangeli]RNF07186.1 hypothetical protein TraAM80_03558 [Trypanosoma rangeli]|eukprot:RNF07186.1 hypothetical protein TraAM80_03558 [Trypanosoma rangeli]
MPPGKEEGLETYTTLLGTKAYILHYVPFDDSCDDTAKNERGGTASRVQRHTSASPGPRRGFPPRKKKSFGARVLPEPPRWGCLRGENEKSVGYCIDLPSTNKEKIASRIFPGLPANFDSLLPTTVVVPPLATSASSKAPLPASNRAVVNAAQASPATEELAVPAVPTAHIPPVFSAPEVASADVPGLSLASPLHVNCGHAAGPSACSADNHQYMMEGGFVYCPRCGVKLRREALVEYSPADCPVTHDQAGDEKEGGETSNYCFLCGTFLGVPSRPSQGKREKGPKEGNASGIRWQPPPARLGVPRAISLGPASTTLERTKTVTTPHACMYASARAAAVATSTASEERELGRPGFGMEKSTITPHQGLGEIQVRKIFNSVPVGASETNVKKNAACGENATETFTTETSLPYPLRSASAAANTTSANRAVNSPFMHSEEMKQEKAARASVPTHAVSLHGGGETRVPSSAPQVEMLYTVGVPGVTCGLPHCALCEPPVDLPLPPVMLTQRYFAKAEAEGPADASVIVVHNHYYHKM